MFMMNSYVLCILHRYSLYRWNGLVCIFSVGVIFLTSLRQKCHVKIKAKCQNILVKVSQMTRVPQVEYHWCTVLVLVMYMCLVYWSLLDVLDVNSKIFYVSFSQSHTVLVYDNQYANYCIIQIPKVIRLIFDW